MKQLRRVVLLHPDELVRAVPARFCVCGKGERTKGKKSKQMIQCDECYEWFHHYPDGVSWSGGSVRVDTGAAGNKDAKAAKAKWKAKYGARARKARPKAHEAMKKALKSITGEDFEKPKQLKQWMDENKVMLKKHGV